MTMPLTILIDLRVAEFHGDRGIPAYDRLPPSSRATELATHGMWCTAE